MFLLKFAPKKQKVSIELRCSRFMSFGARFPFFLVTKMLELQYQPTHGIIDSFCWPNSKYVSIDIPDYRVTKPLDYYGSWPRYWYIYTPLKSYRRYLNNLLLRDMRVSVSMCSFPGFQSISFVDLFISVEAASVRSHLLVKKRLSTRIVAMNEIL